MNRVYIHDKIVRITGSLALDIADLYARNILVHFSWFSANQVNDSPGIGDSFIITLIWSSVFAVQIVISQDMDKISMRRHMNDKWLSWVSIK